MSFYSCKEPIISDTSLLLDGDNLFLEFSDTAAIHGFTVKEEPLQSDDREIGVLTNMIDPSFGITHTGLYSQVRLTTNNADLGANLVCEKLVLSLVYAGKYGPLTKPINFQIHELAEDLENGEDYFTDDVLNVKSALLADVTLVPNTTDSIMVDDEPAPPQLSIELDKALGDLLLAQSGTGNFANDSAFKQFFKGFYIHANTGTLSDGLVYINMLHSQTKLTLYYANDSIANQKFEFQIDGNTNRFNYYTHDYSKMPGVQNEYQIYPFLKSLSDANPSYSSTYNKFGGDSLLFLQPLAGTKAFFYLPDVVNLKDVGINKAELVFTQIRDDKMNDELFPSPTSLFLWRIDDDGDSELLLDFTNEIAGNLGGVRKAVTLNGVSTFQYSFRITRYVQQLINGSFDNNGLFLTVFNDDFIGNRVILGGGNHMKYPAKLKLTYTNLD